LDFFLYYSKISNCQELVDFSGEKENPTPGKVPDRGSILDGTRRREKGKFGLGKSRGVRYHNWKVHRGKFFTGGGMKGKIVLCPRCGGEVFRYESPVPTVDIIIEVEREAGGEGIVLIYRKNQPRAWALPGGFVDYGETLEEGAVREAGEETGLEIESPRQFHTYSDPQRDPRRHTISTVFIARARGTLRPGDDAEQAVIFEEENLPSPIAFDHEKILRDYFSAKKKMFTAYSAGAGGTE
jgi:8-oxo-dGTP diphosphatase